jgi:hypothetical protein
MFVARYVSVPTCSTVHCVAAHRNTRTNSAFSAPNSAAISLTLITAPSRLVSSLYSPRSIPTCTMLGGSAQKIKRCIVSHGCSSLREAILAASRNRSRFSSLSRRGAGMSPAASNSRVSRTLSAATPSPVSALESSDKYGIADMVVILR